MNDRHLSTRRHRVNTIAYICSKINKLYMEQTKLVSQLKKKEYTLFSATQAKQIYYYSFSLQ